MDNRAWIKVGKLDLSSTFPRLEFVAICHVAPHMFHACSSAQMAAPGFHHGRPEILEETAIAQFPFSGGNGTRGRKWCAAMHEEFAVGHQTFPARWVS